MTNWETLDNFVSAKVWNPQTKDERIEGCVDCITQNAEHTIIDLNVDNEIIRISMDGWFNFGKMHQEKINLGTTLRITYLGQEEIIKPYVKSMCTKYLIQKKKILNR